MRVLWFMLALLLITQGVTGGGFPTGPGGNVCMMTMHGIVCPPGTTIAEAKTVEGGNTINEAAGKPVNRLHRR